MLRESLVGKGMWARQYVFFWWQVSDDVGEKNEVEQLYGLCSLPCLSALWWIVCNGDGGIV